MNINLLELWSEMGLPVKAVVVVLTLQAVASLAVALDRLILLARSSQASRLFAQHCVPLLERGDWDAVLKAAREQGRSHLARLLSSGVDVFLARSSAGDSPERAADLARRALERKGESISDELHRGLGVLASTGSTAPFVGLLGTVLGILHAFELISESGSGGLGTIGSSIGEALIVTGYGLTVAIPTVLVFNWISGRISRFELALTNASSELVDRLECSEAPSAPARSERRHERTAPDALAPASA